MAVDKFLDEIGQDGPEMNHAVKKSREFQVSLHGTYEEMRDDDPPPNHEDSPTPLRGIQLWPANLNSELRESR